MRSFTLSLPVNRSAGGWMGATWEGNCVSFHRSQISHSYNRPHTRPAISTACNLLFLENKVASTPRCWADPCLFVWTQPFTVLRAQAPGFISGLGSMLLYILPDREGVTQSLFQVSSFISRMYRMYTQYFQLNTYLPVPSRQYNNNKK
jgi:hypothetical protein